MNGELIVAVEYFQREKGIDREILFEAVEQALLQASKKSVGPAHDLDTEIVRGTDTFLGRLEQRLLDRLEQDFPVDALFALEILHRHNKFAVHKLLPIWRHTPFGEQKSGFLTHSFHAAKNLLSKYRITAEFGQAHIGEVAGQG